MSDIKQHPCTHNWHMSEFSFGDAYFYCTSCGIQRGAWEHAEALQARIAELEAQQQWIPVTGWKQERRKHRCLITNGDWIQIGGEYTGYWPASTTHEMPLPAPPQEQQE